MSKTSKSSLEEQNTYHRSQRLGRNDPCPCGSGKKYKKCCLDNEHSHHHGEEDHHHCEHC